MPLGYISINTQVMLWEFSKYASEMLVHDLLLIFFFLMYDGCLPKKNL